VLGAGWRQRSGGLGSGLGDSPPGSVFRDGTRRCTWSRLEIVNLDALDALRTSLLAERFAQYVTLQIPRLLLFVHMFSITYRLHSSEFRGKLSEREGDSEMNIL
jgi:hypothetical protein